MNLTDKYAILEALRAGYPIVSLTLGGRAEPDPRMREIADLARERGIPMIEEPSGPPRRRQGAPPPAALAVCRDYVPADLHDILAAVGKNPLFLALDHVQDPRNLGAIIRTAAAAAVQAVIIQRRRSCDVTGVVCDTSCGGVFRIPIIQVSNLPNTLEVLKKAGIWVIGADERGDATIYQQDFALPTCLVLGSEGAGLARLVRDRCDVVARIPTEPAFPSLNVSVAASVALFEARRQRLARASSGKT